jgi:hypothetical protein
MMLMSVSKYVGSPAKVDRRDVARDVAGTVRGLEEHVGVNTNRLSPPRCSYVCLYT